MRISTVLGNITSVGQTALAPQGIWPGYTTSASALIGWWPPTGTTQPDPNTYNVYRNGVKIASGVVPTTPFPGLSTSTARQYFYADAPLAPNTTYTYTVTAVSGVAESPQSAALAITTLSGTPGATPPAAPIPWTPDPYALPTGGTTWTCTNTSPSSITGTGTLGQTGCSCLWALQHASYGDVIVLTAGASYAPLAPFPVNAYQGNIANGFVYITTSNYANLPPPGVRVSPADAANMPKFISASNAAGTLAFQPGSNYTRVVGVNFTPAPNNRVNGNSTGLVDLANSTLGSLITIPHHLTFDRCIFGNDSTQGINYSWIRHAFFGACDYFNMDSCYAYGIYVQGTDSYIIGITGGGPGKLTNNYLEAASEGLITGGGYTEQTQVPHDWECSFNLSVKNSAWDWSVACEIWDGVTHGVAGTIMDVSSVVRGSVIVGHDFAAVGVVTAGSAVIGQSTGSPGGIGRYTIATTRSCPAGTVIVCNIAQEVKNHFEMKVGSRFSFHDNVCMNCWNGPIGSQHGNAIGTSARDQTAGSGVPPNTCPWVFVSDVDIYNNQCYNIGLLVEWFTGDYSATSHTKRVRAYNNLIYVNPGFTPHVTTGYFSSITGPTTDATYDHNTEILWPNNLLTNVGILPGGLQQAHGGHTWTGRIDDGNLPANTAAGNILTVTVAGTGPRNAETIGGTNGVALGTHCLTQLTGTPLGVGTYQLDGPSQNVAGGHMWSNAYAQNALAPDRIVVTNNIIDGSNAITNNKPDGTIDLTLGAAGVSAYMTNVVWSNNVNVLDSNSYNAGGTQVNNQFAGSYAALGLKNFTSNTAPPAVASDWNMVTGAYVTSSTTGGPLGCTFGVLAGDPFPRTRWQVIAPVSNLYAGATFQANAAKFNVVDFGPYMGIEQTQGATFASIFSSIKTLAKANGITSRLLHYNNSANQSATATSGGSGSQTNGGTFYQWTAAIAAANWWLRTAPFATGTIVIDSFGATDGSVMQTSSQNTRLDGSGRTFGQGYWNHYDNVLRLGLATSLGYAGGVAIAANTFLDGYQMDNVFCSPRSSGAWQNSAANFTTTWPTAGNVTVEAWLQQGQANMVAALRTINPALIIMGNCDYFVHSTGNFSYSVALDPSQVGLFDIGYCQNVIGSTGGSLEGQGATTTAQLMANLIAAESQLAPGGVLNIEQTGRNRTTAFTSTNQAVWVAADWQAARFGCAMSCIRDYYFSLNNNEDYRPDRPYFMDETLTQNGKFGWLGNPVDPPQSAARTSGVWWRRFRNGVVFMNPAGNGTQVLTLASLGLATGLKPIASNGFGDTSINPVTPGVITSITLQARDGRFLIGAP